MLVSLLPFGAQAKIVLNSAANYSFIQEIGHTLPWFIRPGLGHRISASLGKCAEGRIAQRPVRFAEGPQILPETLLFQRPETVGGKVWLQFLSGAEFRNFPQQQRAHFQSQDAPRETVSSRFDSQRRAARHQDPHGIDIDKVLNCGAQSARFCTSSRKIKAFWLSFAA